MNKSIRVLFVDDAEDDVMLLAKTLKTGGYDIVYEQVDTEETMNDALDRQIWDIILCDYAMPGFSSFSALNLYKKRALDLPFIIVSGTITDETAVTAMKAGAHDYIIKDNLARLCPAVDREIREAKIRKERRQAKARLQKSEAKYRTLFQDLRDAIYMNSPQGRFIEFNQSILSLFGYAKEEMSKLHIKDLFVKADAYAKFQDDLEQAGCVSEFSARLSKKDGSEIDCLITASARRTEDNHFIGYQGVIRDISDLLSSRQILEETLKKLRNALGGTIQAMALTVETRDPYTAGHQRGVSNLARSIATEMGISEHKIQGIRFAGVLHDIGKICVPGEILSKPGNISKNELGLIKEHSNVGYNILKTVDFPWPIARIVLQHHEKLNGSGYPDGLSGENILLEARVVAVADVVEAMASHRPYRPSLGIEMALKEIQQNKNVFYDPQVVDACLRLFVQKGFRL